MTEKKTLTPKQAEFVRQYLVDLNGAEAARRAGYQGNNQEKVAWELMQKPLIREAVQAGMDARAKRVELNSDTILRELLSLATVDVTEAFDDQGGLKPFKEMPEAVRRAIAGLEVNEMFDGQGLQKTAIGLARKLKFYDKTKALELLGKHLKLFTEKHEHKVDESLAKLLSQSWEEKK